MIKAILIDNAGVLINTNCNLFYKKLAKYSSHNYRYIANNFEKGKHHIMEAGKISTKEFHKDMCKRFKLKNYSYKQFKKDWLIIFYKNRPMERFVKKKYKKLKIWILTNTNSIHYPYLKKKFPIYNFIKHKIVSYKIGMAKPDYNIYRYTLKKLKIKPKQCLFIDNKKWNITAAKKLGINTIWYRNYSQFSKQLRKFKI